MVTRGRLTDQMCCWVQRVIVVLLVLGKVSFEYCKLVVDFRCLGVCLLLLALHRAFS